MTAYEDTVESPSERECGLVFALAGYLVHDRHETMPFLFLDPLEAIDTSRIAVVVEYLCDSVPNLIVAQLPEDAAAVDDRFHEITAIWVVSAPDPVRKTPIEAAAE